jgi:hypothetical protein
MRRPSSFSPLASAVAATTVVLFGCSSTSNTSGGSDGGATEAGADAGAKTGTATGGKTSTGGSPSAGGAGGASSGGATGRDASTVDGAPDASTNHDGGTAPTVVAAFGRVPASLALDGDELFVTLAESQTPGDDGAVVTLSKAGKDASTDAGTVTVLAAGLHQPRAVAVGAGYVYWADTDRVSGNPDVTSIATAGGKASVIASPLYTYTRVVIDASVLYTNTNDTVDISSYSLSAGAGTLLKTVYKGTGPAGVATIDSDGASVFFFLPGAKNHDLLSVPAGGGTAKSLASNATSASVNYDHLVDDASTVYWSDSGTGNVYSVPKTGGTPKVLATFKTGSSPVQIALDGTNIYALSGTALSRFPKTGGAPVVLASVAGTGSDTYLASVGNAVALAIDATDVYWLYEGHGEVLKTAK